MSEITKWGTDALARVDNRLEVFAEQAATNDALMTLSDRTIKELEELDVCRALVSAADQSAPGTLTDLLTVTTRLAHGCASTAWVVGVYACGNYVRSLAPMGTNAGDGERTALVLGRPSPNVEPADGGVVVSGQWPYASGVDHASASCVLIVDPRSNTPHLAVLAASEYEVERTWNMPGMRGTGSNTIIAEDIFVPDDRLVDYQAALNGELTGQGEARYSLASLLMIGLLGSLVGSAERSLGVVVKEAPSRRPPGTPFDSCAVTPPVVQRLGRESLRLDQVRLLANEVAAKGERAARGEPLNWASRAWARAGATQVATSAREVVDGLVSAYGTSALLPDSVLNRAWRDTHVGSRHAGFGMDIPEYAWGMATVGHDPRDATAML